MKSEFKFCTNVDFVYMVVAWALELDTKEEVEWMLCAYVPDVYLSGLKSLLARAVLGEGLQMNVSEGVCPGEESAEFRPFMLWRARENRVEWREDALIGWESLKKFM
ncbi:hypothetical protein SUGI_0128020 [Cryptomeria japonica]|nr:hypothetical protein SUGI_0128020 [Cryptomeria japonica]